MKLVSIPANPVPDDVVVGTLKTPDRVDLRFARWAPPAGRKGTVCIFQGRAEFIEKYYEMARELRARGFAVATLDWRGQGHSSRAPLVGDAGHVETFADYQKDVAALLAAARAAELPEPFFLLAHSMGGAIGLRALIEGLPVRAAAFSAPMWGIEIAPHLRPLTYGLSALTRLGGLANHADSDDELCRLDGRAAYGLGRMQCEEYRRLHGKRVRREHDLPGRRLV